jgi:hypothetical protein
MALITFNELKRGDTWNPTIRLFSDKKKTVTFDATGFTGKCHIKERMEETADDIEVLDVDWDDEANGVGHVNLTYAKSVELMVNDDPGYYVQFKVYNAGNTIVKTPIQGILPVVEVLEKEIS